MVVLLLLDKALSKEVFLGFNGVDVSLESINEFGPSLPKRRFLQAAEAEVIENGLHSTDPTRNRAVFKGYYAGSPPAVLGRVDARYKKFYERHRVFVNFCFRTIMLEEEISLLHKEIAQLKRQVMYMIHGQIGKCVAGTGDASSSILTRIVMISRIRSLKLFYFSQNVMFQVSDLTATNEFLLDQNATLRVSSKRNGTVSMPAVTLSQNNTAQPQPQVIRTVTASVATVPVSLATVSTCNPVSGNPVSIAGCPAVSIASPAQILAPSQQILGKNSCAEI